MTLEKQLRVISNKHETIHIFAATINSLQIIRVEFKDNTVKSTVIEQSVARVLIIDKIKSNENLTVE